MKQFPESLQQKLQNRKINNTFRQLSISSSLIDFASNDYLGYAKNELIFRQTHEFLIENNILSNGATGSRLLTGNHSLYTHTENYIAHFHKAETALLFNSGYDANLGLLSAIAQRNDLILYDELCHASIRDGILLSTSKAVKFKHNDWKNLEQKILKFKSEYLNLYIVVESIYSMDGDSPNLKELVSLAEKNQCHIVVDEAHALGVMGNHGVGLVQSLNLQHKVFARIVTFGKALGCHGAAILGNKDLKEYLVNFARSFIYTTGLSPHTVASILLSYKQLSIEKIALEKLNKNIQLFNTEQKRLGLNSIFVHSTSAIQCAIISGNENVKMIAQELQKQGFDVKPILSPTVAKGQERLRFCLHSYNSETEIIEILQLLNTFV